MRSEGGWGLVRTRARNARRVWKRVTADAIKLLLYQKPADEVGVESARVESCALVYPVDPESL